MLKKNKQKLAVAAALMSVTVVAGIWQNTHHRERKLLSQRTLFNLSKMMEKVIPNATASEPAHFSYRDFAVNSYGSLAGFKHHEDYVHLMCGDVDPGPGISCDGPPESGILGIMSQVAEGIGGSLEAGGIASCELIPSSGSQELSISGIDDAELSTVNVTFQSASHSVPSGWANGGTAFAKRLQVGFNVNGGEGDDSLIALEFNCGSSEVFMAFNGVVGDNAPGYLRRMNLYSGTTTAGEKTAELYMTEMNPDTDKIRGGFLMRLEVDEAANQFKLWGLNTGGKGGGQAGVRLMVHGDYSTETASVGLVLDWVASGDNDDLVGSGLGAYTASTFPSSSSHAFYSDITVPGSFPVTERFQGCVDLQGSTSPSSNAVCSGLDLSDPTAPLADSAGEFSESWMLNLANMDSKIDTAGLDL